MNSNEKCKVIRSNHLTGELECTMHNVKCHHCYHFYCVSAVGLCICIGHSLNLWLSHLWNMYRHWDNNNNAYCVCCSFHFMWRLERTTFPTHSLCSEFVCSLYIFQLLWMFECAMSRECENIVTVTNQSHSKNVNILEDRMSSVNLRSHGN